MRKIRSWSVLVAMTPLCFALASCSGGGSGSGFLSGIKFDFTSVELAHDLVAGNDSFPKGTVIFLGSITGATVSDPHPPTASDRHLHASDPLKGILIYGKGPFFDPDPEGGGYGKVVTT